MPSYQNNQIGMAALMLLLASASPALAQRADANQPMSLIEDAAAAGRGAGIGNFTNTPSAKTDRGGIGPVCCQSHYNTFLK